jgi:hypothetical protein
VTEFAAAPELVRSGWAARRPLSWAVHQESWGQRGLPGEEPAFAIAEAAAAQQPTDQSAGKQSVVVVVVDAADPAQYLHRPEVLVVQVGPDRPATDFGVLWRPARTVDEAIELGVEVARDLALQGVGELTIELTEASAATKGLARGIRLGGLACGSTVRMSCNE